MKRCSNISVQHISIIWTNNVPMIGFSKEKDQITVPTVFHLDAFYKNILLLRRPKILFAPMIHWITITKKRF